MGDTPFMRILIIPSFGTIDSPPGFRLSVEGDATYSQSFVRAGFYLTIDDLLRGAFKRALEPKVEEEIRTTLELPDVYASSMEGMFQPLS